MDGGSLNSPPSGASGEGASEALVKSTGKAWVGFSNELIACLMCLCRCPASGLGGYRIALVWSIGRFVIQCICHPMHCAICLPDCVWLL